MSRSNTNYVGRFAPSPTGPLHFGSIVASLGSYLDAKYNKGTWLLRIDDLDMPRVESGAVERILYALDNLGMHWDGSVVYQSRRFEAYQEAEHVLESRDLLYRCYCSRKLIGGKPYPGTCRKKNSDMAGQYAIRIKTDRELYTLHDQIQPEYTQNLFKDIGDFIVKRADGLYAYHLAVALDDAYQKVSHIVRGADLMDSSPRQMYLQKQLSLPTPIYAHLPVALSLSGHKISKQAKAVDVLLHNQPTTILVNCLSFLGQNPDKSLLESSVDEVIQWGIENWKFSTIPRMEAITAPVNFRPEDH
ncbi:MAG: glutamyl-Q tRNA(Asp) synthetase [Planctomycetota bacterium]|jgi:glutamyl-Q tRNA(Asp) synthetase